MKKALLLITVTILVSFGLRAQEWSFGNDPVNFPISAGVPAGTTVTINGLAITAGTSPTNMGQVEASVKTFGATTYQNRFKFNGGGYSGAAATDVTPIINMPTQRYISFPISGNSTITVHGLTGSNGSDRKLFITDGTNFIGSIDMLGTALTEEKTFNYSGPAVTLYMFCNAAINLYYLKVAQVVLYEDFNYTPPAFIGGNGAAGTSSNNWTTHSVTTGQTTTIDVVNGNLTYPGFPDPSGNKILLFGNNNLTSRDVNRAITSNAASLYYSALINLVDNSQITTTGDYFMHFGATSGASNTVFGARLGAKSVNSGANYRLIIQNTSGGTPTFTDFATDLNFGTTYLVVVKYDRSASPTVASLWVNPASLGGSEPAGSVSNASGTSTFATFGSICLRNNATTPKVNIDEIRVGRCWTDVTKATATPHMEISEIMYNPPDAGNDSLEFIELYNQGTGAANMKDWYFSKGPTYKFPDTIVAPGAFYVIARNASSMKSAFGLKCAEWTAGYLDDDGETLELSDNAGVVKNTVSYLPGPPWPLGANNQGHSISLCDLTSNNNLPGNWSATAFFAAKNAVGDSIFASPGKDCTLPLVKAAFSADKVVLYTDGKIQFTDASTNSPISWKWTFLGGTPSTSTEKNPLIQYKAVGIYPVSLKVKNLYGADSINKVDYIQILSIDNSHAYTFTPTMKVYDEPFDSLGSMGTSLLPGWTAIRYAGSGTIGAPLTLVVSDGSGNSGGAYNVGTIGAADRALGTLASGSTVPRFGASFLNSTNTSIIKIDLTGMMEQWRSGSNSSVNEVSAFEYSLDATDLSSGTWVAVPAFDLVEKLTTTTVAAAVNGNAPENQTALTASINGIIWTPNSTLLIRWSDVDNTGSDGLYAIDNFKMTVTTGGIAADPEPTNYPTAFSASAAGLGVKTQWTDATGTQTPAGYLVKISKSATFTVPVDGTYTTDDLDLSDGSGAKNVAKGQQQYTFTGLDPSSLYYFKVYPYTNSGTLVDYKTDGSAPTASATTQAKFHYQNFDGSSTSLLPWTQFSVTGDQFWVVDSTHGVNSSKCAKMSGYLGGNLVNEDWLISPAFDFSQTLDVKLQFQSAYNYAGTPLLLLVSTDYTSGNPATSGTWTDITSSAIFSPGAWAWTPSGLINLNVGGSGNVHVAFKYTSDLTDARTWEIDEVLITANSGVGVLPTSEATKSGNIYPNPASNFFQVQLPENGEYRIRILNAQGAVVKSLLQTDRNNKIFTNGMRSGLYFITIENLKSNKSEVHKLMIK